MNKKILIAIIVITIFGGSFGIYSLFLQKIPRHDTEPLLKVTLGVEKSLLPISVWVAENKGYFREKGLDITIKGFDSGRLSFLAMLNGEVDISTVAPTPIMFTSFKRQDFYIFATFVYSFDDLKVIARKDRGINTAQDLKGKKIGTPLGTTGQFFTDAFLIHNRILNSEVDVIDIAPPNLPEALKNNEVDAIVIWEPHAYNTRQLLPNETIRLPSIGIYKETFNFMVMKDFAKNNRETLKRFLDATNKATLFAKRNKEESMTIVEERLKLDRKCISSLWRYFILDISLENSLILTLEDEAQWAIENGLTNGTKIPNYLNFIYVDALKDVKPEAVTIIH